MPHNKFSNDGNMTTPLPSPLPRLSAILHIYFVGASGVSTKSPAIAVEFMEVSGVLLVSSSSGMSRIPPCRWCPRSLLVAKERANRRAEAATTTTTITSVVNSRDGLALNTTATASEEGFVPVMVRDDDNADGGIGIVTVRESESVVPHELSSRRQGHVGLKVYNAGRGCGGAGGRPLTREEVQTSNGDSEGENETRRNIRSKRRSGDVGGKKGVPSEAIAEREWTPQAVAGVGDVPEIPPPIRSKSCVTPREGGSIGDRNKISILDHMSAKFSSMPTSPPPPNVLPTKVRQRKTGLWLGSRIIVYCSNGRFGDGK